MLRESDRRAGRRTSVSLLLNRYLDGQPYMCRAKDISPTGIRLVRLIEPARELRYMGLEFQLPGCERVITASGEAVFVDAGLREIGVRFTTIAADHAALIEGFVRPWSGQEAR